MKSSQVKVSVNFKIQPFGHVSLDIKSSKELEEPKTERLTTYMEPKTTDIKMAEITFDGDSYIVPKTTSGIS